MAAAAEPNLSLAVRVKKVAVLHADGLLTFLANSVMQFTRDRPTLEATAVGGFATTTVQEELPLKIHRVNRALIGKNILFLGQSQYPISAGRRILRYVVCLFFS